MEYFKQARNAISPYLVEYLRTQSAAVAFIEPWGTDVVKRLEAFTHSGKMIRGGLAMLGHELYGGQDKTAVLACATAMELFQSGFLIHDDIMDRDRLRRGKPSFFMQYVRMAEGGGLKDPYHQGESLGICGGDVALFLAYDLLAKCRSGGEFLAFCMREIMMVGLAQMQDVWFGASPDMPSEEQILRLYAHKTGRYSFSLPMMAGAMLAGQNESDLAAISRLGELMGVIFQIRDDELGIFGEEGELGKPVGSDIREGKKTIFFRALLDAIPPDQLMAVEALYGSEAAGAETVQVIRQLMESSGARQHVQGLVAQLQSEAAALIATLPVQFEQRQLLERLLVYISSRVV